MGLEEDRVGESLTTHRRGESIGAPPAYPGLPTRTIVNPVKREKDTESINSSVPPDSPTTLDHDSDELEVMSSPAPAPAPAPVPAVASVTASDGHESLDVNHPFAFPSPSELPSYAATEAVSRPVAVPQLLPYPDVGLLIAYPPSLLTFGIPESTWLSFLTTLSSFLDATISQQAVEHAAKLARSTANIPKKLGMGIYSDTKHGIKQIGNSAKKGNVFGVVGPVIGVPLSVVGRTVGSIFSLRAVYLQRPETPRQRADVYVESANKRWFHQRGLHGRIVSTAELATIVRAPVEAFSNKNDNEMSAQHRMDALTSWIAPVSIASPQSTDPSISQEFSSTKGKRKIATDSLLLGKNTLWLVLVRDDDVIRHSEKKNKVK